MIRLLIAPVSRLRGYFPPVMGSVILVLCCSVSAAVVLNGCNSAATTGRTSGPAEPLPLDVNPAGNSVIPSDGGGALSLIRRATPEPTNSFYSTPSDGPAPTVATTAAPTVLARPPETTPTGTQPDRFPTLLATGGPAVEPEPPFIPTLTVAPVQANTPLPTDKTTPVQTPSPAPTSTPLPIVTPTPSPVPTSTPQPTATYTPTPAPVPTNTPQPTATPSPRRPGADQYAAADRHAHADHDADQLAAADRHSSADQHANQYASAHTDTNPGADQHAVAYGHANSDRDANQHTAAHTNTNPDQYTATYADCGSYADTRTERRFRRMLRRSSRRKFGSGRRVGPYHTHWSGSGGANGDVTPLHLFRRFGPN